MNGWECLECGSANPPANPICGSAPCQDRRLREGPASPAPTPSTTPASPAGTPAVSSVAGGLVLDPGSRASTPPTRTKHTYPPAFELWWKEYPRHEDKIAALRAWKRVVAGGVSEDQLREAAVRYRNDPNRKLEFTKFGERWLNAGAYLDDGVVLRPEAHEIGANDARYQSFDLEEHLSSLAEIPAEPKDEPEPEHLDESEIPGEVRALVDGIGS